MMVLAERTRGGLELELIPKQALLEFRECARKWQRSLFALTVSGLFLEVHNLAEGTDDGVLVKTMRMRFVDHPTSTKGVGIGVSLYRKTAWPDKATDPLHTISFFDPASTPRTRWVVFDVGHRCGERCGGAWCEVL